MYYNINYSHKNIATIEKVLRLILSFCFVEFQRQVMRQLVTLNARAVEHSKYFDLLMLMVNDIKDKLEKV